MEIQVPSVYVVNRELPAEQASVVMNALSITPVHCAVIFDRLDAELAFALSPSVIRRDSEEEAMHLAMSLAKEFNRPVLVVGEADFLDGLYADGHREAIAAQC